MRNGDQDEFHEAREARLETFEDRLGTCPFVCSGTEANEIEIRLARFHTGNKGVIVADCANHSHSQSNYEISTRDVPVDQLPDYALSVPAADIIRGEHKGDDAVKYYV